MAEISNLFQILEAAVVIKQIIRYRYVYGSVIERATPLSMVSHYLHFRFIYK